MKIFDYIDAAYYINLDYRVDRRESFEKRIKQLNIPVTRFDAIQFKENELDNPHDSKIWHKVMGCALSHQSIIKKAKELNLQNVWILEDDCIFVDNFTDKAQKCIDDLKNIEWDMFYFGGELNKKAENFSDSIVKVNGVYGAHSYLVNHTFYNTLLSIPFTLGPIDIVYLNYNESQKKFYLSKELLCLQDGELISDLLEGKIDREEIYRTTYKMFVD